MGCRLDASHRPPPLTQRFDPTDRKVFLVVQPGLYHEMQYASVRWLLQVVWLSTAVVVSRAPIGGCSPAWLAGWPAGGVEAGRHAEWISHGCF